MHHGRKLGRRRTRDRCEIESDALTTVPTRVFFNSLQSSVRPNCGYLHVRFAWPILLSRISRVVHDFGLFPELSCSSDEQTMSVLKHGFKWLAYSFK